VCVCVCVCIEKGRGFFIYKCYITLNYNPGVDPASNRNEYQENFLGVKAAGA